MKSVVLKLSGELLTSDMARVKGILSNIKKLLSTHRISIVIGGGNLFRGQKEGRELGLRPAVADTVGMLATVMNGLILKELLISEGVDAVVLNACAIPGVADAISQMALDACQKQGSVVIFTGGTGNPFVTTDTCAIIRALQVGAREIWKATKVDGIYDADPVVNPAARLIKKVKYDDVLQQHLGVLDATAVALARQHNVRIRIFSLFTPDVLLSVADDPSFGSSIE
jgi:uridylate kinase